MAFDRTNQADLLALQSEVQTDPLGMGYAAVIDQTNLLLKLLNDPDSNVGGETEGSINVQQFINDIIDPNDLTVGGQFSQGELEWVKMIIESAASLTDDISAYYTKLLGIFAQNTATGAALRLAQRSLSRAEVLFGSGTVLTREDWAAVVNLP